MRRLGTLALSVGLLAVASSAEAQSNERIVVLVVDAGSARLNTDQLGRAIAGAIDRTVVRLTDERAEQASGRLTIAYSTPDRWVLRYEAQGQVAWVSDRISRPGALRSRLVQLSRELVARIDASPAQQRRRAWIEDVVVALQNELVDPFTDLGRPSRPRPISVLWSEVIDPFHGDPPRAQVTQIWSEVLDPWATEVRRPAPRYRRR